MQKISIQDRCIGEGCPCFIIADAALSHDGSLGAAHAFIDAVAKTGADAVKFQAHIAEAEGTKLEQFRTNVFPQDATRQDYWKRTAFTTEQWSALKNHADERGLVFLCSPFSPEAVRMLTEIGVPAWKTASGETTNIPMLREMAASGLPLLLSTGMSRTDEVDQAVRVVLDAGCPLLLMQCTNRYPCPPEHLGLNVIGQYRERYNVPVGLSDHSGKIAAGIAAFALGACAIEIHAAFSRKCFGPDVSASLTFEELTEMVAGIRFLEKAFGAPVDKDAEAAELGDIRSLFTKSIVAADDIAAGTVLGKQHLGFKKPGTGISAAEIDKVVGARLRRDVTKDELFQWDDLTDA